MAIPTNKGKAPTIAPKSVFKAVIFLSLIYPIYEKYVKFDSIIDAGVKPPSIYIKFDP